MHERIVRVPLQTQVVDPGGLPVGGGLHEGLEEGLVVTAAVGKAAKEVLSSASNDIVDATNNTTSPISIALEHHEEGKLNGNNEADSATEFSIEDVESGTSS